MKKIFKGVLLSLLFLIATTSWAQNKTVSGRVTGEKGSPVFNASIVANKTKLGTSTNEKGEFSISVPAAATTLTISSIGYESKEVAITAGPLSISLTVSEAKLDEVVVVGYGTQKKSVVTGAISSVKAKDLEKVPSGRIEQALQGRVAGVTVAQNSGQPGSPSKILIRGVTTFGDGGNNPLWVVDGVVVDAGGIGYLNQSDIESIEVLKDASSASIYGTRAASGVIMVSTKKGKSGKLAISYNGFYGTSAPAKMLDLLNATQYGALLNERSVAGGGNVVFTNAMRSDGINSAPFMRTTEIERHRIWLNLKTASGIDINQMMVGYIQGATQGVDFNYDGLEFGNSGSSLSSKLEGANYCIQGRSLPFASNDVVPLGFKASAVGNYTISLTNTDGMFAGSQDIFVRDNLMGTDHNIKVSPYTFASDAGTFDARFELVYTQALGIPATNFNPNSVIVYKNTDWFHVNTKGITMKEIQVYDISGRLIYKLPNINGTTTVLKGLTATNEVLFLKITSEDNVTVTVKAIDY